jgi:hypothetical protein
MKFSTAIAMGLLVIRPACCHPAENIPWPVHPGSNRLAARTVNQFGVIGPVSTAEVDVTK